MNRYPLAFLALLSIAFTSTSTVKAQETNADPECRNGPDGLANFGAQQTCIESTEFIGERCFFTFVPQCAGEDAPVVFDIHAYNSCPLFSAAYSGWIEKANENCFVVVLPLGVTDPETSVATCWGIPGGLEVGNMTSAPCCCNKNDKPVITDDEAFLLQVAAVTARDVPIKTSNKVTIDTKRIYMAGHSNGCMASIYMAAMNSDMVAAVGCHAGTATVKFPESYSPTPMFLIHGKKDEIVAYDGSDFFIGAPQVHGVISDANGCTVFDEEYLLGDDNNVTEYTSSSCTNDANVVLYAIDGVGHLPYPAAEVLGLVANGTLPTKVDTTQLAWDFMKSFSLEDAPELIVYELDYPSNMTAPSATPEGSEDDEPEESSSYGTLNGSFACLLMAAMFVTNLFS